MKNEKLTVRLATSSDKDEILELLNEGFKHQQKTASKGRGDDFWNWKYLNSAFGEAVLHVIEQDSEILAFGTLWPFEFKYEGQLLKAFQPCDTIVSKKARGKGLFRKLNEARKEYARSVKADFLFNFPNQNSLPGYLKMGWSLVDKLTWQVKVLKPLQVLKNSKSDAQSVRIEVQKKYALDSSQIQKALANNVESENLVELNATSSYYEYRYKNHPSRNYGLIEYVENGETAIAIFTLMQKENLKEMVVMEVIASKNTYSGLLNKVVKEAKFMDVGYIAMVNQQNQTQHKMILKGFFPKKNKNFVCLPLNKKLNEKILQIENWNLFASIHDSI